MDLSVLIPARNEMWLKPTIDDVLKNRRARTEIVIVCDGEWPFEPIPDHPDVHIVYHPIAVGQRAATNEAARISNARFVMKLDAHCAVSPAFDVALIEAADYLGPNVTQIPKQFNLHVFNWKCLGCGTETYQGPTPTMCTACAKKGTPGGPFERVIVWHTQRRLTEAWRFDADLKFGYFGEWKDRIDASVKPAPEIFDTMSCLGACWFLSRTRYWELGGLDERHGSWGQMGTELACKTWLSGGRMVVNRRAYFSHLFRTQGADFGFPYPLSNQETERARQYSRDLWMNNAWPQQVHTLRWLVERFWPVPGWTEAQLAALPSSLKREVAA